MALVLIFVYLTCCAYNLVWLVHPRVGKLEGVLSGMIRKKSTAVDALDTVFTDDRGGHESKAAGKLQWLWSRLAR